MNNKITKNLAIVAILFLASWPGSVNFAAAQDLTLDPGRVYGGNGPDSGHVIAATEDGGFVVAGQLGSYGRETKDRSSYQDLWVLRFDAQGLPVWSSVAAHAKAPYLKGALVNDIAVTSDGGVVIAGTADARAEGGQRTLGSQSQAFLVKIDQEGRFEWAKHYELGRRSVAAALYSIPMGRGYVLVGQAEQEAEAGKTQWDGFFIRVTAEGAIQQTLGVGTVDADDSVTGIARDGAGGYRLAGWSSGANTSSQGWSIPLTAVGQFGERAEWAIDGANAVTAGRLLRTEEGFVAAYHASGAASGLLFLKADGTQSSRLALDAAGMVPVSFAAIGNTDFAIVTREGSEVSIVKTKGHDGIDWTRTLAGPQMDLLGVAGGSTGGVHAIGSRTAGKDRKDPDLLVLSLSSQGEPWMPPAPSPDNAAIVENIRKTIATLLPKGAPAINIEAAEQDGELIVSSQPLFIWEEYKGGADLGVIRLHLKPEGEGYKVTVRLPMQSTVRQGELDPVLTLTLGAQEGQGIWSKAGYFTTYDTTISNVTLREGEEERMRVANVGWKQKTGAVEGGAIPLDGEMKLAGFRVMLPPEAGDQAHFAIGSLDGQAKGVWPEDAMKMETFTSTLAFFWEYLQKFEANPEDIIPDLHNTPIGKLMEANFQMGMTMEARDIAFEDPDGRFSIAKGSYVSNQQQSDKLADQDDKLVLESLAWKGSETQWSLERFNLNQVIEDMHVDSMRIADLAAQMEKEGEPSISFKDLFKLKAFSMTIAGDGFSGVIESVPVAFNHAEFGFGVTDPVSNQAEIRLKLQNQDLKVGLPEGMEGVSFIPRNLNVDVQISQFPMQGLFDGGAEDPEMAFFSLFPLMAGANTKMILKDGLVDMPAGKVEFSGESEVAKSGAPVSRLNLMAERFQNLADEFAKFAPSEEEIKKFTTFIDALKEYGEKTGEDSYNFVLTQGEDGTIKLNGKDTAPLMPLLPQ